MQISCVGFWDKTSSLYPLLAAPPRGFLISMTAPVASGGSEITGVGLSPTGKVPPFHGAHPKRLLP